MESLACSPSRANGMFSIEMIEKFLLSSIRVGINEYCFSSSFPSPPGEFVRDELWGAVGRKTKVIHYRVYFRLFDKGG